MKTEILTVQDLMNNKIGQLDRKNKHQVRCKLQLSFPAPEKRKLVQNHALIQNDPPHWPFFAFFSDLFHGFPFASKDKSYSR